MDELDVMLVGAGASRLVCALVLARAGPRVHGSRIARRWEAAAALSSV
jgi:ribulose 1,5-bisphosphate synthetase/thiazole synthase